MTVLMFEQGKVLGIEGLTLQADERRRGQPLGPLVNKKKRYRPDFLKQNRFCRSSSRLSAPADPILRFHCMNRILPESELDEAIRSVSHLGLACVLG